MPISWGSPSCLQAVLGVSVAAAALAVGPVLHLPRWRLRTPIVSPAMAITLSVLEFHSLRETVMFVDVWFVVSYYGGEIVDPQFFRIDPQAPVLALVVRRRDFPTLSNLNLSSDLSPKRPSQASSSIFTTSYPVQVSHIRILLAVIPECPKRPGHNGESGSDCLCGLRGRAARVELGCTIRHPRGLTGLLDNRSVASGSDNPTRNKSPPRRRKCPCF